MNSHGRPIDCGVIDTSHISDNLFEYGQAMRRFFQGLDQRYSTDDTSRSRSNDDPIKWIIGVEDFHKRYSNSSSANTLFKLSNCNTLCSYEAQNVLSDSQIIRTNVNSARSFFQIPKPLVKKSNTKEIIFNMLKPALPPTYKVHYFKRNGTENLSPRNFDVSDSLLIGLYSFMKYHTNLILSDENNLALFIDRIVSSNQAQLGPRFLQLYENERNRLEQLGIDEETLNLATALEMLEHESVKTPITNLITKQLEHTVLTYLRETLQLQPLVTTITESEMVVKTSGTTTTVANVQVVVKRQRAKKIGLL